MPIYKSINGTIVYTQRSEKYDNGVPGGTGVFPDNSFAIADKDDQLKQLQFDAATAQGTNSTTILTTGANAANSTVVITLPAVTSTLSTTADITDSFTVMQTDFGTYPVADSGNDILTFTSDNSSVIITGNETTDTINLAVNTLVGDSGSGGTKGLAPAPAAGDGAAGKFLKADGTWSLGVTSGLNELTGDVTAGPGSGAQVATIVNVERSAVAAGTTFAVLANDASGNMSEITQFVTDATGALEHNYLAEPDGNTGSFDSIRENLSIEPLQNSPDETWRAINTQINIDPNSSGFDFGTTGAAVKAITTNITHGGTSDIGEINLFDNNFSMGNGTDPIDVNGISYSYGFGTVNANVNISGPIQGYGFQPSVNASATIGTSEYLNAFYDSANIGCAMPGYTSYNASPTIASINNNNNYNGFTCTPNIPTFTGNAGFIGINVSPTLGTFNTNGYFNGVSVAPTITSARYAAGLNVSMDSVTPYAGVAASLVIQDLTIASDTPGSFLNGVTVEYTGGGTAGSEVVSLAGLALSVQIESGVSTANQIAAALNAYTPFTQNLNVTISGVGGNAQVTQAATNLAGGIDAGSVKAAYLDGDVEITGALSFGGALSIGKLNAFASQALIDGGGTPASVHSLVSNPTVAANATIANADTLGVNTAMLLTMGDNSTVTTSFVGLAALALPAVVNMGTGATIDQVSGATFAVSLDAAATGGTIANLDLCRSIAIPNGATAITQLSGYKFDLPFGDPGTTTWGFYASPDCHNYFAGNLKISGTNTVTNSSVGLEIGGTTKAFLNAKMTSTQRDALTAVNGMQVYNTTTDKLQVYAAGSWVDLH